jgi:hypothetical protein
MHRRKGSGVVTGALVLIAAGVAVRGYFWLTAQPLRRRGYPLVVQLADAGGLQQGDRVRVAGVPVGTVRHVSLRDGAVVAEISVDRDLSLPRAETFATVGTHATETFTRAPELLLTAATHVDEAALGATAFVRDVHARPERYIRISLF